MGADMYWEDHWKRQDGSYYKEQIQEATDEVLNCKTKLDAIRKIILDDESFKILKIKKILEIE